MFGVVLKFLSQILIILVCHTRALNFYLFNFSYSTYCENIFTIKSRSTQNI